MPAKTGASHAVAAFVSILLGGLISDLLGTYATAFTDLGRAIGEPITGSIGLSLPATTTGHLLIATGLAFAWGVAYHYARHGSGDGEQRSTKASGPSAGQTATDLLDSDGTEIPEALSGIVTAGYAPDAAKTADAEIQSHLETTLGDDVRTRLAEAHDLLVDEERRDLADRIASLESDLERIERSLSPGLKAAVTDSDQRDALREAHVDLVETAAALRASAKTLESAARGDRSEATIREFQDRYEDLRDAHDRRRRLIEHASDTL